LRIEGWKGGSSEGIAAFNQPALTLQAANHSSKTLQQPGSAIVASLEKVSIYFAPHFQKANQHQCFEVILDERAVYLAALFITGPKRIYLLMQEEITSS
jgi:hypothetical protein